MATHTLLIRHQILPKADGFDAADRVASHPQREKMGLEVFRDLGRRETRVRMHMSEDAATREKWALFEAEAAYADGIFRSVGDTKGCIRALERAVGNKPDYAPAILSLGSVEYQRKRKVEGRKLLLSLVAIPDAPDYAQIIDAAGDFLIKTREYADVGAFHRGRGCCAGHCDEPEEAVAAARRALELEPNNQKFVNDLGWSLIESGALQEAQVTLERAVAMDPADELARENLRLCNLRLPGLIAFHVDN